MCSCSISTDIWAKHNECVTYFILTDPLLGRYWNTIVPETSAQVRFQLSWEESCSKTRGQFLSSTPNWRLCRQNSCHLKDNKKLFSKHMNPVVLRPIWNCWGYLSYRMELSFLLARNLHQEFPFKSATFFY